MRLGCTNARSALASYLKPFFLRDLRLNFDKPFVRQADFSANGLPPVVSECIVDYAPIAIDGSPNFRLPTTGE
jgi:hypothetical protein